MTLIMSTTIYVFVQIQESFNNFYLKKISKILDEKKNVNSVWLKKKRLIWSYEHYSNRDTNLKRTVEFYEDIVHPMLVKM